MFVHCNYCLCYIVNNTMPGGSIGLVLMLSLLAFLLAMALSGTFCFFFSKQNTQTQNKNTCIHTGILFETTLTQQSFGKALFLTHCKGDSKKMKKKVKKLKKKKKRNCSYNTPCTQPRLTVTDNS